MRYTWDKTKNAANIRKHSVSFEDAERLFEGPFIFRQDRRKDYGEIRHIAIGAIQGIVFTAVYTERPTEERRIISLRRANRKERQTFQEAFQDWN